jgi:hypothetical protein
MKTIPLVLTVLVASATGAQAQTTMQQMASAVGWSQSQETNPTESYAYTRYLLVGKSPSLQTIGNRPALAVNCIPGDGTRHGKFLNANLLAATSLKVDWVEPEEIHGMNYLPKVVVKVRTDDSKNSNVEENWAAGNDKASATIPRETLKKILESHSVSIDTKDDHGAPLPMNFDIPNASSIERSCDL